MVESHQKAAEMHARMAACLASDQTVDQCRQEMAISCGNIFDANCLMRSGMRGQGKGRGMIGDRPCMGWMFDPGASGSDTMPRAPLKK